MVNYHPEKMNVVADVLSRMTQATLAHIAVCKWKVHEDVICYLEKLKDPEEEARLYNLMIQPALM